MLGLIKGPFFIGPAAALLRRLKAFSFYTKTFFLVQFRERRKGKRGREK